MSTRSSVLPLSPAAAVGALTNFRVRLREVSADGTLWVCDEAGRSFACDWMENPVQTQLAVGDELLAMLPSTGCQRGVVLGRIGAYGQSTNASLIARATESLQLQCGESSIDLRADGKVVIRGDDVLVRAKGTKRIRAGTVSIN